MYMSLEFEQRRASASASATTTLMPYPLSYFQNITNQPIFADGASPVCDNMIRLFGSAMSTGEHAPVAVEGSVASNLGPFGGATHFANVWGIQVATPFIENNFLDCTTMKGYRDTWNAY
jgi:hypothetical protein